MNGIIIIDKPLGRTSHDMVYVMRKMTGIKRLDIRERLTLRQLAYCLFVSALQQRLRICLLCRTSVTELSLCLV